MRCDYGVRRLSLAMSTVLLLGTLLLGGCDSSLSDVDLENPGLIELNLSVRRSVGLYGDLVERIEVTLLDKNNDSIELRSGEVRVNGKLLKRVDGFPHDLYRLPSPHAPIAAGQDFVVAVTLADGETYESTVTAPEVLLTVFSAPDNHDVNEAMTVSWGAAGHEEAALTLSMTVHGSDGYKNHSISITDRTSTSYEISSSYFTRSTEADRVHFALRRSTSAAASQAFRGGVLRCTFKIEGNSDLYRP